MTLPQQFDWTAAAKLALCFALLPGYIYFQRQFGLGFGSVSTRSRRTTYIEGAVLAVLIFVILFALPAWMRSHRP